MALSPHIIPAPAVFKAVSTPAAGEQAGKAVLLLPVVLPPFPQPSDVGNSSLSSTDSTIDFCYLGWAPEAQILKGIEVPNSHQNEGWSCLKTSDNRQSCSRFLEQRARKCLQAATGCYGQGFSGYCCCCCCCHRSASVPWCTQTDHWVSDDPYWNC